MRKNLRWIIISLMSVYALSVIFPIFSKFPGCKSDSAPSAQKLLPTLPILDKIKFNADSAYVYTEKIVSMSPRIVGTPAADKVRAFVVNQFKSFGCDVIEQKFPVTTFDGKSHNAVNIIARTNLQATKRILLSAHWDSRPFSDQDKDSTLHKKPCLGADDSATGMAELLEIARQAQLTTIEGIGIDIILFDAEDYGATKDIKDPEELTWCLGSRYWAQHPHVAGYTASYGINLDMTGAVGARFEKEGTSLKDAPLAVDKVWRVGRFLGYTNYFLETSYGELIDDSKYVSEVAHIPCIDIINHDPNSRSRTFGDYWHTQDDNMKIVDRETMRAVGQTILAVLCYESANAL